jgi:poly(hydroxyalkanoate) granule-associated protein
MSEEIEVREDLVAENGQNAMLETARKVLLAGIGAVALAQDEIEEFVSKLVERGEIAEKDGRRLINDIADKRKSRTEKVRTDIGSEVDKRMESLLKRMNIPSKSDIEGLNRKISALSRKIDQLKKAQQAD